MSVFIVPASMDNPSEASERRRRPRTPKRTTSRMDTSRCSSIIEPGHNFLMKAGGRAYEQRIEQMRAAAAADLKSANDALANELVRSRSVADEEKHALSSRVAALEKELSTEQERLRCMRERADHEARLRQGLEMQQQMRMKEIQKRFREEHSACIAAETECAQLRQAREALTTQVQSLSAECREQREALSELRSENSRLEATVAADAALLAELRSRLSNSESRLESEQGARVDAQSRAHSMEVQLSIAQERNGELAANLAESESRLRAASSRVSSLEDECGSLSRQLIQEKDVAASSREAAGKLQRDLTELQTAAALASTASTADRSELERLNRELSELQAHLDEQNGKVAELREAKLMLMSELATSKGTVERLQMDIKLSREELQSAGDKHEQAIELQQERHQQEMHETQAALQTKIIAAESDLKETQQLLEETRERAVAQSDELKLLAYQAEHFKQVFADNERLAKDLKKAENTLKQKEALLVESLASHNAQLEMWRSEATEVAQAASKWKQRSLLLQSQVDSKENELSEQSEAYSEARKRASRYESECSQHVEMIHSLEARCSMLQAEVSSLRTQLQDAISAQQTMSRRSDSAAQELGQRDAQLDKLASRLAEEQSKASRLRQEVATMTAAHVKELDSKSRMLTELTMAVQKEERTRLSSQQEATALREHLQAMERELRNAQTALASVTDSKLRREGGYAAAEMAVQKAASTACRYKEIEESPRSGLGVRKAAPRPTAPARAPAEYRATEEILEQASRAMMSARWDPGGADMDEELPGWQDEGPEYYGSSRRSRGRYKSRDSVPFAADKGAEGTQVRGRDDGGSKFYADSFKVGRQEKGKADVGRVSMDVERPQLDQRRYHGERCLRVAPGAGSSGSEDGKCEDDGDSKSALERLEKLLAEGSRR